MPTLKRKASTATPTSTTPIAAALGRAAKKQRGQNGGSMIKTETSVKPEPEPEAETASSIQPNATVKSEDAIEAEHHDGDTKGEGRGSSTRTDTLHETPTSTAQAPRQFYPPEMSNARCAQYDANELPRPIDELEAALAATSKQGRGLKPAQDVAPGDPAKDVVVHWFRRDLRLHDNRSLALASARAAALGVPLVCLYVVSPQDYSAHGTSRARVDFDMRSLRVLQRDLAAIDVPLHVETVDVRKQIPARVVALCRSWGARALHANIEYEVDELRRDAKIISLAAAGAAEGNLAEDFAFAPVHDDVVVRPGDVLTKTGSWYSVYSPWYRAWLAYIAQHPDVLDECPAPKGNPDAIGRAARDRFADTFSAAIPAPPEGKRLESPEREAEMAALWPAGEHEALARLKKFVAGKISAYGDKRSQLDADATAVVSVHLSAGTLAARTAVRMARDAAGGGGKDGGKLDAGPAGIRTWISEVAWRDFYKHLLVHWPYVCMNKPFKYHYSTMSWEYSDAHFRAWCEGRTGYPVVDAAMRQMASLGWMHNRARMIVASFLSKHLLLDWRAGERHFMENLIDGDFASNSGGWGWSASVGADPQPYFRIFNPLLQSEKFDPQGAYIRKWIPELRGVQGKAIHDPYGRGEGARAEKAGYPRMIVEHKMARARALERFKSVKG